MPSNASRPAAILTRFSTRFQNDNRSWARCRMGWPNARDLFSSKGGQSPPLEERPGGASSPMACHGVGPREEWRGEEGGRESALRVISRPLMRPNLRRIFGPDFKDDFVSASMSNGNPWLTSVSSPPILPFDAGPTAHLALLPPPLATKLPLVELELALFSAFHAYPCRLFIDYLCMEVIGTTCSMGSSIVGENL